MTDTVAIISPDESFAEAARSYLETHGLLVYLDAEVPARLPSAQTVFVDCEALDEVAQLVSLTVKARGCGTELVLCGHWSNHERLEAWSQRARVQCFEYPLHPWDLQRFFVVNRFKVEPVEHTRTRLLADIAGCLYQAEGVAVGDLEALWELSRQRMVEVMTGSLEQYGELLTTTREELSLLAEYLQPNRRALFSPSALFSSVREQLRELPDEVQILSLSQDQGREALALAMLLESENKSGAVLRYRGDEALRLEGSWLRQTPFEYRAMVRRHCHLDGAAVTVAEELTGRVEQVADVSQLASRGFDLIVCRRVDQVFDPTLLKASLEALAGSLASHGTLLLGPGETILLGDFPLKGEKFGILTGYRKPAPEEPTT